ncbi:hypothetical protein Tco_0025535 [Tanacetum coccineum]
MDAPPSSNHIIDFPANKPTLELEDLVMEVVEDPMEDSDMDIDENEEDEWEEDDDLLMAPVTPPRATSFQLSSYEVRGASSAVLEALYPVGRPLLVVAARVTLHHGEIEALCVRAEKMEYMQTSLVRKVDGVSDAQVADNIAIGELQPRITTVEEGVWTLVEQGKLVVGKLDETET